MSITVVNRLGFFMMLAAFGLAYAMRLQWSWLSDGILLAVAAGICLALDTLWRVGKGKRKWFRNANGGSILCMPLWLLGLAWLGMCVYRMSVGPIPAMAKAAPLMTWTTSPQAQQSQPADAKSKR